MSCAFNHCDKVGVSYGYKHNLTLCKEHREEIKECVKIYKKAFEKQQLLENKLYDEDFDISKNLSTCIAFREAAMNEIRHRMIASKLLSPEYRDEGHKIRIEDLFRSVHEIDERIKHLQNMQINMREAIMNEIRYRMVALMKIPPDCRDQGDKEMIDNLFKAVHSIDVKIEQLQNPLQYQNK